MKAFTKQVAFILPQHLRHSSLHLGQEPAYRKLRLISNKTKPKKLKELLGLGSMYNKPILPTFSPERTRR